MACNFSPASPAGKWLGFVTALWVQAFSGNNHTFSNYSIALKTLMSLTQLQLNNLSIAKDVGKTFGIFAGLASESLPPSVTILIGSVVGLVGYGAQWLVVSRRIQPLPYWAMCVFLCLGGNSTTWMNTAVLATCMRNFFGNRGQVSGILKGYVGLSTAIFTGLCSALFADDPARFLLMLAIIPFVVCLAAMIFLREIRLSSSAAEEGGERRFFSVIDALAVVIAVYLMAFDLTGPYDLRFSRIFAAVLLILLATPIAIPIYLSRRNDVAREVDIEGNATVNAAPLLADCDETAAEAEIVEENETSAEAGIVEENETSAEAGTVKRNEKEAAEEDEKKRMPEVGEELTVLEAVKTVEFWILFVSFLCGITGLAVMNNMGQIGSALGYSDISTLVSLTSIFGFFGRFLSGSVSEYFIRRKAIPRPIWNAASQILMATGYIVLAAAIPGSLHVGASVLGLCYGVRLAITVATASELFGLSYFGSIYNIIILNIPLGSFLFSSLVAGILYDREATPVPGGGNTCIGAHCYRLVFHVMAVVCVVGLAFDVLLVIRTRRMYARICAASSLMMVQPLHVSFLSNSE